MTFLSYTSCKFTIELRLSQTFFTVPVASSPPTCNWSHFSAPVTSQQFIYNRCPTLFSTSCKSTTDSQLASTFFLRPSCNSHHRLFFRPVARPPSTCIWARSFFSVPCKSTTDLQLSPFISAAVASPPPTCN